MPGLQHLFFGLLMRCHMLQLHECKEKGIAPYEINHKLWNNINIITWTS